jgi:transposase-like protein
LFSPEIRKAVYTTNAIESVNYTIRKIIKHRQPFPNGGAAVKLIFMGLKKTAQKWTMPVGDWGPPSINSRPFMGKTGSLYDVPFTQLSLQVPIKID